MARPLLRHIDAYRQAPQSGPDADLLTHLERDAFLWSLGSLCQLHRQPFDSNLLLQQFPPPYTLASLQHAAQGPRSAGGGDGVLLGFFAFVLKVISDMAVNDEVMCLGLGRAR